MDRSKLEKIKYNAVRNYTMDVAKARQARGWSWYRIYTTYGIREKRSVPKSINITSSNIKRAKTRLKKLYYALEKGVTIDKARKLSVRSWEHVRREAEPVEVGPQRERFYDKYFENATDATEKEKRKEQWQNWSKKKVGFPAWLENLAKQVNERINLDSNARYGFAVVFEAYTNGQPITLWESWIAPDHYDGDIYHSTEKRPDKT